MERLSYKKTGQLLKPALLLKTGLLFLVLGLFASPSYASNCSAKYESIVETIEDRSIACANELIELGHDLDIRSDKTGNTALMEALKAYHMPSFFYLPAKNSYLEMAGKLVSKKADPNIPNNKGDTPLIYLTKILKTSDPGAEADLMKELFQAGAKPNAQNNLGETPLMYAVGRNRPDLVEILLEAGADPDIEDKLGRTAINLAEGYEKLLPIAELLRSFSLDYHK